jgi:ribosomal protein L12E/L44/L45/RPP1/RPP2
MDLDDAIAGLQRQNQVNATKAVSAKLDELQAELARQRQEQANKEANMPDCPWCGGKILVGFVKCKNCSSDLIWLENLVGKPGDEKRLREVLHQMALAEKAAAEKAAAEKAAALEADKREALERKMDGKKENISLIIIGCILVVIVILSCL